MLEIMKEPVGHVIDVNSNLNSHGKAKYANTKGKYQKYSTISIANKLFRQCGWNPDIALIAASVYTGKCLNISPGRVAYLLFLYSESKPIITDIPAKDVENFLALYHLADQYGSNYARDFYVDHPDFWF